MHTSPVKPSAPLLLTGLWDPGHLSYPCQLCGTFCTSSTHSHPCRTLCSFLSMSALWASLPLSYHGWLSTQVPSRSDKLGNNQNHFAPCIGIMESLDPSNCFFKVWWQRTKSVSSSSVPGNQSVLSISNYLQNTHSLSKVAYFPRDLFQQFYFQVPCFLHLQGFHPGLSN